MKKSIVFCALALLCGSAQPVQAEEGMLLDTIVVTPGRTQQQTAKTAGSVTVISRGTIEKSQARTIPELLNNQGAVIMRDYIGNGKSTNADIRGFGESGMSNVLVLIDGRKVNNIDLSGTDWTQLPISMVERIEVMRGSGSILYGDNASGGVINIITKAAPEKFLGAKASVMGGSFATYSEKAEVSLKKDKFSALAVFDQFRTDGYRINSDLIRNDFNGKLSYDLNEVFKAKVSFGNHRDKYGLPGALTDGQLNNRNRRASVNPDDHASSRDYYLRLGTEADFKELGKLEASISRRKRDTSADFVATTWMTERDTITYDAGIKYSLDKKIYRYDNKLLCGFDYLDAEQDVVDGGYSGNPDKLTLSRKNYGFYATDQFFLNEKLSFSAGNRFETVQYNFEQEAAVTNSDASSFKDSVWSAALNYEYLPGSNVYASFTQSFRYPLVDEVYTSKYIFFGSPGGGLNAGLTPQTAKTYELGLRHSFNKDIQAGLTGYIMPVKNEIYYDPVAFANLNYDRTRHRGLEATAQARVSERIKFFGGYTFTDAFFKGGTYEKRKIPAVPVHKWNLGGEFKLPMNFSLSLIGNYTGERYFISDQLNILPRMSSYFTLDAKLSFEKGAFTGFAGINNLLDEKYYEYGAVNSSRTFKNYYPAAERNFVIGGSVKF